MGIFGKKKEDEQGDDVTTASTETTHVPAKKAKKAKKDEAQSISVAAAYDVIVGPVITEKAHALAAKNQYVFQVNTSAEKKQVKDVVEKMYDVHVEDVRMIVVKPKRRTVKYNRGYQKKTKKAVVTVKKGQSIAIFQGV